MIGGSRFALARAKAAAAPLVTLAVVAAIAAALVTGVIGAVQAAEAREVRSAIAAAPADLGRYVVSVTGGGSADEVATAVEGILSEHGLAGAVDVTVEGDAVVVAPDAAQLRGDQVAALSDALVGLGDEIEDRSGASVQIAGALDSTLDDITADIESRRGPTAVAIGILGLLTAVVVGAVARETVRTRESENRLLRARGARRRDLLWAAAVEALVVALIGAVVGAALGVTLSVLIGGLSPGLVIAGIAALAIALVAAVVVAVATSRGADRGSSRARAAVDIGLGVILAVVTGLAAWQFWQAGTPIVTRGDGTSILDPLVAIAPALVLGFAALLAVALATPLARLVAASLSRTRGVSPITPLRLGSRRPARHALSIVSVAFALGAVTVAAAYGGSLTALGDAPEELRVGADVRVGTIPDDVDVTEIAALQPADAAMLARQVGADSADGRIPILAVEAAQLGAVMRDAGGTIDPGDLGELLAPTGAGVPLAGDTLEITAVAPAGPPVTIDGEEYPQEPAAFYLRASVLSESGALHQFVFTNFEEREVDGDDGSYLDVVVDADLQVSLELPDGGPWSLVGLDAALYPFWYTGPVDLQAVSSGGEAVDVSDFGPAAGTLGTVEPIDGGVRITPGMNGDDYPWTRAVSPTIPSPMPAVVTAAFADSLSLTTDERFSLELDSPDFPADFVVAQIIPVLPGTAKGEGILVDLATLSMASPTEVTPNQVWMSTDDPAALAAAVEGGFPQTITMVADPSAAQNAAATWIGFALAAAGAVVLAIVVLVLRRTRSRADSRELATLAAMGLGRRRAARLRAGEDLFAVGMGVLGGLLAGAATAWLIVPPLVRAAYGSVPAAYPVALQVNPLILGGALLLATGLFVAIVLTVRAPAQLAPLLREDE